MIVLPVSDKPVVEAILTSIAYHNDCVILAHKEVDLAIAFETPLG